MMKLYNTLSTIIRDGECKNDDEFTLLKVADHFFSVLLKKIGHIIDQEYEKRRIQ